MLPTAFMISHHVRMLSCQTGLRWGTRAVDYKVTRAHTNRPASHDGASPRHRRALRMLWLHGRSIIAV